MKRVKTNRVLAGAVLLSAAVWSACSASGKTNDREAAPTPAVAGFPRAAAVGLISSLEGLERGWYAGAVGWSRRVCLKWILGSRIPLEW